MGADVNVELPVITGVGLLTRAVRDPTPRIRAIASVSWEQVGRCLQYLYEGTDHGFPTGLLCVLWPQIELPSPEGLRIVHLGVFCILVARL